MLTDRPLSNYYRPRAFAVLTVPVLGTRQQRIGQAKSEESLKLHIRPKRVRLHSNSHNEADTCTVTCDWQTAGVDPRLLDDAVLQVHIDDADAYDNWSLTEENCRFIGMLRHNSARRSVDTAGEVTLEAVDYTDCFLRAKPFGSSGVPHYNASLEEAWRTIVSQTPGAESLADNLIFEGGVSKDTKLGKAVAERFAKLGKVPTSPETDAWAVWMQCVGMLGLISYIRRDKCIVTTATNYYTERDSPVLIWGQNISEWTESRDSDLAQTGVCVTSFDPLTQSTLEAYWPPIGDERVQKKAAKAKKVADQDAVRKREKRDYFSFPGITELDALTELTKRIWEERSRNEMTGSVTTHEMRCGTVSGQVFDMLSLAAGDTVEVRVNPFDRQLLSRLPSPEQRIRALVDRGYSVDVARLLVANMEEFGRLGSKFHVRDVTTELATDREGGSFSLAINYLNRLTITGDTE